MGNKFGDAYREEQRRIHREALRPRRAPRRPRGDSGTWRPGNNGTVSGQSAEVQHGNTGRVDRVDAYWPSGTERYGHLASNDGVNADYLREPGMGDGEYVVDNYQENPYG